MSNFNFTALELNIVNNLVQTFAPREKRAGNGGYGFFDMGLEEMSSTWADVLIEETGDPKIYRGVVVSLCKKGLFERMRSEDGTELYLTAAAVTEIEARIAAL